MNRFALYAFGGSCNLVEWRALRLRARREAVLPLWRAFAGFVEASRSPTARPFHREM